MEKGCYVKDITPPGEARGLFAVSQAVQGQSRNGPYWRLTLADASGALEAKIGHPLSAAFNAIPVGTLVWAEGRAGLYRDQVQLSVEQLRLLTPEECAAVDQAALLPASPYPLDDMLDQLTNLCKAEFVYPAWRKLALGFLHHADLRARFRVCPAAKSVHHAYVGGLLEHTLGVFTLCRRIADQYPELDRQTLLAGALFHDVGKIREFSGGVANDYTTEGRLLGHLMLGLEMLSPLLAKSGLDAALQEHFKHLVLSHHGTLEFGAVRLPQTPEALALHYADNLDAKMAQCRGLFAQLGETGQDWTPWQATLSRPLYRAAHTPQPAAKKTTPPRTAPQKVVKEEGLSLVKA